MSTVQQVQEILRANQLTPQSFVQFHCNKDGIIKFLSTLMTSDPLTVHAIQTFMPLFAFSLETAFQLKKENLLHLPGINEIFIDKILIVLDHTKLLIQQLESLSSPVGVRPFTTEDLILPPDLKPQTRVHVEGITTPEEHEMVVKAISSQKPSIVQRPGETMYITFEKSSSSRAALQNIKALFPTKKAFVETRKQLLKMTDKGLELYKEIENFGQKINEILSPQGTTLLIKKHPRKNDVRFYFEVLDGVDESSLLEIVCHSIVDLINREKGLISRVEPEPEAEEIIEESVCLPSQLFQFVQMRCKIDIRDIQQTTGIEFQFGAGNTLSFSGPQSKVISAKNQLQTLTDSVGIGHFPQRSTRGEIELTQRASYFLILDMLKHHKNNILFVAEVKRASIEFVGRTGDLELINQEISKITASIITSHIDFSPLQMQNWMTLIDQNPNGLKGVFKRINSECSVTMKFREDVGRLEIAGNQKTIDQARQIIGNMIGLNKDHFPFLGCSPSTQFSIGA